MKHLLLVSLLTMSFFHLSGQDANPDFRYPKTVAANAETQLSNALSKGDGDQAVDALIRYSLAQSAITQENAPQILQKIAETRQQVTAPDIRALLSVLQARVTKAYQDRTRWERRGRTNPTDVLPENMAEWDDAQFEARVQELLREALDNEDTLATIDIHTRKALIETDEDSHDYFPRLIDFIYNEAVDMTADESLRKQWVARWEKASEEALLPTIRLKDYYSDEDKLTLYRRYADHEAGGLLLSHTSGGEETYPLYQEYLAKYPKSPFVAAIRNLIQSVERKFVALQYGSAFHPSQPVGVNVRAGNVREAEVQLYRVPDSETESDSWRFNFSKLTLVATETVRFPEHQPWETVEGSAEFAPQTPGYYVIVPRFKVGNAWKSDKDVGSYHLFNVSHYALFSAQTDSREVQVFAVDGKTGQPRRDVALEVKSGNKTQPFKTGGEGYASVPVKGRHQYHKVRVNETGDRYAPEIGFYPRSEQGYNSRNVEIFTDLAIYRPGETMRFTAVAYRLGLESRTLLSGEKAEVSLHDSNWETVGTRTFTTDSFGQIDGEFVIPADRMNGTWTLKIQFNGFSRHHAFEVAEYKTPAFFVSLDDTRDSYDAGQPVVIRGKAETYSGLPMAGHEVRLLIRRTQWSWWWNPSESGETMQETVVYTAADGSFEYTVPAEVIAREKVSAERPRWYWPHYRWTVNARVTDAGGESHEADASFRLGRIRELAWSGRYDLMLQGKTVTLPVVYRSTDDNDQKVTVAWQLCEPDDTAKVIYQGEFKSSEPVLNTGGLKSGAYLLRASVKGDGETAPIEQHVILYRENDSRCYKSSPLWIPEDSRRIEGRKFHVLIGTDREAHIWCVAQSRFKIVSQGWLDYKPGLHHFTMLMPEGLDERLTVDFFCVSDFRPYKERVTMLSPRRESINLSLSSFRDRLVPGSDEEWTFTVRNQDSVAASARMFLELYNQALQDLADNRWKFAVPLSQTDFVEMNYPRWDIRHTDARWQESTHSAFSIIAPEWKFYGRSFFSEISAGRFGGRMLYSKAARAQLNDTADGVEEVETMAMAAAPPVAHGRVMNEIAEVEEDRDAGETSRHLSDVPLRQGEIKVALWEPSLSVGEDGTCIYRFKAPESNATWALQAIAFNRRVQTSGISRTLVTQRPVMVQPKLPRFVRTGDEIRLEALVQNATDTVLTARYEIEVFDPFTNEAIAVTAGRKNGAVEIAPKASVPVGVSVRVPSGMAQLAFRIKAADGTGNGDGEQQALPVLPNVSPVVETQPFYMQPAEDSLSMALPAWPDDARLTLEVCANPVWYAVLALPVIADGDYVTATSLAHNLFALCLAEGLVKDNPQMAEAIHHWTENNARDSVLVSQLEKNADLKITSLQASPWLPEARRQTERMSRLEDLTDSVRNAATRRQVLGKLKDLQQADGGIAWFSCGYLRSSYWATETLLQLVGELHSWGYAKDDETLTELCRRAIRYYDSETVRLRDEMKRYGGKVDYAGFAAYAYTRSLWPEYDHKGEARKIADRAVSEVSRRWGEQSLVSRAYTALTLHNRGESPKQARAIVESLRQHALTQPGQGMYWDGIRWGGYRWWNPVTLTSVMLQTFRKVDPRTDEIDAIRQWLLLEKKTTDWGNSSLAADAVAALMACGTRWEATDNQLSVSLGGESVTFPAADRYLGYSRVEVSASAAAKTLSVIKQGKAPAWGSLYAQYESPMSQTAAARTQELTVTKELLRYQPDGSTVHPDTLAVGDKIQVRLVIRNERDLEYVSLVDERGACFEPADQISEAVSQDGLYYYRETKDSATRLFFDRLPKGTHVFTWDLNVTHAGQFAVGIATVQCQYSPDQTAHSEASEIGVNR